MLSRSSLCTSSASTDVRHTPNRPSTTRKSQSANGEEVEEREKLHLEKLIVSELDTNLYRLAVLLISQLMKQSPDGFAASSAHLRYTVMKDLWSVQGCESFHGLRSVSEVVEASSASSCEVRPPVTSSNKCRLRSVSRERLMSKTSTTAVLTR